MASKAQSIKGKTCKFKLTKVKCFGSAKYPVQKIKRKGARDKIFASIKSHKNVKILYIYIYISKHKEVENVKKIWIDISLKVRTVLKMFSFIREIQLKPQWNNIAYLLEWLKWKTVTEANADSDTEKLEQS